MADCLHHRGPDASGFYEDGPVAIVHRRLSVIGLGKTGAQPMHSASGRYVISYNGELYNHLELRAELDTTGRAPTWRGSSDTETLLAGVEAWGLERFLTRSVGMYAFALWDRNSRRLTLVRDRFGEKPLYWCIYDKTLLFASQPSALRQVQGFTPSVDRQALSDLLRYAYIPGQRTIHREVNELLPGHLVEVGVDSDGRLQGSPAIRSWWSFLDVACSALERPLLVAHEEQVDLVADSISEAVHGQLLADVPVGAFLSGGIDSSLVVATMQKFSSRPVRTFTIGYAESSLDESSYARAIAEHLGTEHSELIVTAAEAQAVLCDLPKVYDEPLADAAQLPTLLLSQLARRDVTVALTGEGGDEVFAGYGKYTWGVRRGRIPRSAALLAAGYFRWRGDRPRMETALSISRGPADWARRMSGQNPDADRLVLGADTAVSRQAFESEWERTRRLGGMRERLMGLDTNTYLPFDILHKVDRAAMSVSLETRVPFLDHRLVELAWRLSSTMRVRDGVGKWVLREVLARTVPRRLFERPKQGFGVPLGPWLRGPLRPWAEDLLDPVALSRDGLLNVSAVRQLWQEHLTGHGTSGQKIWPILMYRAWAEVHR